MDTQLVCLVMVILPVVCGSVMKLVDRKTGYMGCEAELMFCIGIFSSGLYLGKYVV